MSRKWWVLAAVACGTFMATLDAGIVNIALTTLRRQLHSDLSQVRWVILVYFFVITCLLLPFGRISDTYGRKRIFTSGFATFTLGSFLCALSPSLNWLIFGRLVQATGSAMLMANGPALITTAFPKDQRGGALGILAMIVSLGLISGPAFGGVIVDQLGWRTIFWINIPIGFAGIAIAIKNIHRDSLPTTKLPFDWLGSIVQFLFLFFLVELFEPPNLSILSRMPFPPHRSVVAICCVLLLAILVFVEQRSKNPVLDFSLFRDRVFSTSVVGGFCMFTAYSAISVLMPMFLEESMAIPTGRAGVLMTAIPITMLVTAPISGRLSDKKGSRGLCASGALILVLSLLAMAGIFGLGLHREMPTNLAFLSLCGVGLGMGLFQSPNNNSMMSSVEGEKLGVASAMIGTIRNLGAVMGSGLGTGVFSWIFSEEQDFIRALHLTFLLAASIAVLGLIATVGKGSEGRVSP